MKRVVAVVSLLALSPAFADENPLRGSTTFAGGDGTLSLHAGWVDIGVAPVGADGLIVIDGTPFAVGEDDHIDGSLFGGTLTFNLPGNESSWLGSNLRLKGSFDRQRGTTEHSGSYAGPSITSSLDVYAVSGDGRAFAISQNSTTAGAATVLLFGPGAQPSSTSSDANGALSATCTIQGALAFAGVCAVTPPNAAGFFAAQEGASQWIAAATAHVLTGTPLPTTIGSVGSRSVEIKSGSAGVEGDYAWTSTLTLSPYLGAVVRETKFAFNNAEFLIVDGFNSVTRYTEGRIETQDIGIATAVTLTDAVTPGFEIFASANASLARRKANINSQSITNAIIADDGVQAGSFQVLRQDASDTAAAFVGGVELGGAYTLQGLGIGPLRASVVGGLSYDSAVATRAAAALTPGGPITGPIDIGRLNFEGETSLYVKGAITVELP